MESTRFQVLAPPCFQISASWSKFSCVTNWFWAAVTTASPSRPIRNSWYLMPLASQACFSSSEIAREASWTSVSPAQNFVNPPPVPDVPTVTFTPDCSLLNSSAIASLIGATVEEPSTAMLPERLVPPPVPPPLLSSVPPHAAATRVMARVSPSSQPRRIRYVITCLPPEGW